MAESDEASDEGGSKGGGQAIVVVEADAAARNLAEDLEDDLERQVIAVDSADFDLEGAEEIVEAEVYVINWDLGIRAGVDLLEQVRQDPRLAHKVVVMAIAEPTAVRVRTALELGADAICLLPYDGEELKARLAQVEARRSAEAA